MNFGGFVVDFAAYTAAVGMEIAVAKRIDDIVDYLKFKLEIEYHFVFLD